MSEVTETSEVNPPPRPTSEVAVRPGRGRLISKIAWSVFGRGGMAIFMLTSAALLARVLTVGDFARYSLYLSFVAIAAYLGTLGLNITVLRWLSESCAHHAPHRAIRLVRVCSALAFLFAVLVSAGCGLATWYGASREDGTHAVLIFALCVAAWTFLQTVAVFLGDVFRGFQLIRESAIFGGTGLYFAFTLAVAVLSLQGRASLLQVVIWQLILLAVNAVLGLARLAAVLKRMADQGKDSSHDLPPIRIRALLAESVPQVLTLGVGSAMVYIDLWALGLFGTENEIATYSFINRLMLGVTLPLSIVNVVLPPMIAELYTLRKLKQMEDLLRSTATVAGLPTILVLVLLILGGGTILGWIKPSFSDGALALALVSLGRFVFTIGGSGGFVLMMTGRQVLSMVLTTAMTALYALAACLAAAYFDMNAVALVSAIFTAAQKIVLVVAVYYTIGVRCDVYYSLPLATTKVRALLGT